MAELVHQPARLHDTPPPAPVDGALKRILVEVRHTHPGPAQPMELIGAAMPSDSGMPVRAGAGMVVSRVLGLAAAVRHEDGQEAMMDAAKPRSAGPAPAPPAAPPRDERRLGRLSFFFFQAEDGIRDA